MLLPHVMGVDLMFELHERAIVLHLWWGHVKWSWWYSIGGGMVGGTGMPMIGGGGGLMYQIAH